MQEHLGPRSEPPPTSPPTARAAPPSDHDRLGILADHTAVLAAVGSVEADPPALLAALRRIAGLRRGLDEAERRLIEASRGRGVSWARIADALGLASRQAAEQRWLRLSGEPGRDPGAVRRRRKRQHFVDASYGPAMPRLRAAVTALHRLLDRDPTWDDRHPRAGLARATLALAATADPRALFALALQAGTDLDAIPRERIPAWSTTALDELRRAIAAATPRSTQTATEEIESGQLKNC